MTNDRDFLTVTVLTAVGRSFEHKYPLHNDGEDPVTRRNELVETLMEAMTTTDKRAVLTVIGPFAIYKIASLVAITVEGKAVNVEGSPERNLGFNVDDRATITHSRELE